MVDMVALGQEGLRQDIPGFEPGDRAALLAADIASANNKHIATGVPLAAMGPAEASTASVIRRAAPRPPSPRPCGRRTR